MCENEVGVHFRTVYNKDNMFIFSFCVFGMTLASIDIKCIRK